MLTKIFLVLRREYITRVRKKSFIVMTILAPLLIALFYGVIIYFAVNKDIGETSKTIFVNDRSGMFNNKLRDKENIHFTYGMIEDQDKQKKLLDESDVYAVLNVPDSINDTESKIVMACNDQPSLSTVGYIENQFEQIIKDRKLKEYGISQAVIETINKSSIRIETIKSTENGFESSSTVVSTAIGFACAMLIYFFIFLYGVQVMQGVIEEKTNRIVEVIISSLKPFELMMGKILGIALVGLTQFVIWLVLVTILGGLVSASVMGSMHLPADSGAALAQARNSTQGELGNIFTALGNYNYKLILGMFLFYFIAGYLFYGSLFAAVGSAVDNETDKQQFMLPITLPLIFAIVMAQSAVVANPNSLLAFWLSVIPFTSPIVMMVRIPFGVPAWEIGVSVISMIAGFIFTVWIAGRIYRIGILMYGKKPSYKEIGKWLFYKG